MTEKRQTSQGYIIRILQHFATKLRNITNFVMLFQAVIKFLSDLSRSKFYSLGNRSIVSSEDYISERALIIFNSGEGLRAFKCYTGCPKKNAKPLK